MRDLRVTALCLAMFIILIVLTCLCSSDNTKTAPATEDTSTVLAGLLRDVPRNAVISPFASQLQLGVVGLVLKDSSELSDEYGDVPLEAFLGFYQSYRNDYYSKTDGFDFETGILLSDKLKLTQSYASDLNELGIYTADDNNTPEKLKEHLSTVQPGSDEDAVILSAINVEGLFRIPFNPSFDTDASFNGSPAKHMQGQAEGIVSAAGYSGFTKLYSDGFELMIVELPNPDTPLSEDEFLSIYAGIDYSEPISVSVPAFEAPVSCSDITYLIQEAVPSLFEANAYMGFAEETAPLISIKQVCSFKLDHYGSSIKPAVAELAVESSKEPRVVIDRTFEFALFDEYGNILFVGIIDDVTSLY